MPVQDHRFSRIRSHITGRVKCLICEKHVYCTNKGGIFRFICDRSYRWFHIPAALYVKTCYVALTSYASCYLSYSASTVVCLWHRAILKIHTHRSISTSSGRSPPVVHPVISAGSTHLCFSKDLDPIKRSRLLPVTGNWYLSTTEFYVRP